MNRVSDFSINELRQISRLATESFALDSAIDVGYYFLSYSRKDKDVAVGFGKKLLQSGIRIYIDENDDALPHPPSAKTAKILRDRIRASKGVLLLATKNSVNSRWCPWELALGDGMNRDVAIVPIYDDNERKDFGVEYLSLYPFVKYVSGSTANGYAEFGPERNNVGQFTFVKWLK